MKRYKPKPAARINIIPEFCRTPALLTLAYVMQLVAVLLTLASMGGELQTQQRFLLLSLYLQWLGFSGAAVLCMARRWLAQVSVGVVFFACWGMLVLVTLVVSDLAWHMEDLMHVGMPVGVSEWDFVLRTVAVGAIVSLLLLRYFWERHQWQEDARAEAEGRYLALQARIRPHFLFNALNSLAELIRSKPAQAEEMVMDLSDLFRVSLDSSQRLVPLSEEIEIVKGYLRIEEVRLGDKLFVNWELEPDMLKAKVPHLILQPLVENAVLHGISRLRGRGTLHINARRHGEFLIVDVDNPVPPEEAAPRTGGTGTAVNNIAQRIKLIYGERASLQMGRDQNESGPIFRARLKLPYRLGDEPLQSL